MKSKAKILVIDDEASIRFSLEETLTRDGYQVMLAESGEAALELIDTQTFDLALIDLKLPDISGIKVLEALQQHSPETITIVLTAHASLETAVEALRQGAHDYLFKPCKTVELRESIRQGLIKRQRELQQQDLLHQVEQHLKDGLADIQITMKKIPLAPALTSTTELSGDLPLTVEEPADKTGRFLKRGKLMVDFPRHIIILDNQMLELSPIEFNLLAYLMSEAPRVVPSQELVRELQGYEGDRWEASQIVRQHIYRIRQKIKAASQHTDIIRTVRGVGYTIAE